MHTFQQGAYVAHYNSDFSGEVVLGVGVDDPVRVPARFILGLVAEYVRLERISLIEQLSDAEVLGVPAVGALREEG